MGSGAAEPGDHHGARHERGPHDGGRRTGEEHVAHDRGGGRGAAPASDRPGAPSSGRTSVATIAATMAMFQPEMATTWVSPAVANAVAISGAMLAANAEQDPRSERRLGLGHHLVQAIEQPSPGGSGDGPRSRAGRKSRPFVPRGRAPGRRFPAAPGTRGSRSHRRRPGPRPLPTAPRGRRRRGAPSAGPWPAGVLRPGVPAPERAGLSSSSTTCCVDPRVADRRRPCRRLAPRRARRAPARCPGRKAGRSRRHATRPGQCRPPGPSHGDRRDRGVAPGRTNPRPRLRAHLREAPGCRPPRPRPGCRAPTRRPPQAERDRSPWEAASRVSRGLRGRGSYPAGRSSSPLRATSSSRVANGCSARAAGTIFCTVTRPPPGRLSRVRARRVQVDERLRWPRCRTLRPPPERR